jgi:RHS repeat-associated protein
MYRTTSVCLAVVLCAVILLVHVVCAQSVPPTGVPAFGSFNRDSIDTINLSNLNIHFEFPIFAKKGRGLDFHANLAHDNMFYQPVQTPTTTMVFQINWFDTVWQLLGPGADSLQWSNNTLTSPPNPPCVINGVQVNPVVYSNFVYLDATNTPHSFGASSIGYPSACVSPQSVTVRSTDGLYVLSVAISNQGGNFTTETVTDNNGNIRDFRAYTLTDPNGNQFSAAPQTPWVDTTGNQVLTSTATGWNYPGQSGGLTEAITTTTTRFTVQTQYHCPNISDLNQSVSLTTQINLPDSTSYKIVYESTTGTYPSTTITGRIHSITLPSNATVTYTYTGGTNGINCQDGSPAVMTKTTPDGPWVYNHYLTMTGSTTGYWTTIVTDPAGNDTVYTFGTSPVVSGAPAPAGLETERQIYQGSHTSGALLNYLITCYNGNFTNCPLANTFTNRAPLIVTRKDVYSYPSGVAQPSLSEMFYDNYGRLTQHNEFDFGVNTGAAPASTPIKATKLTYATIGTTSQNIVDRPACVQVTGGSSPTTCGSVTSNTGSITKYLNYDSHGNVGTIQNWISGSTYVSRTFTYYPTGLVQTETDARGNPTSFTYGACNNSYLTMTSLPMNLSTSMTWDCNGGVPLTSVDENGRTTTYTYNDPFWRTTAISYPDGGSTTTTYNDSATPATIVQNRLIKTGVSLSTQTTLDGLGRTIQTAITSDPDTAVYTDLTYNGVGTLATQSNPHRSTSSSTDGTTGYAYDALGRTTQVTDPDNSLVTTGYSANCSTTTDEALKSRKTCIDALGRIVSAWEDPNVLNYETDYTYDALGNLLSVVQKGGSSSSSWRTRTFTYDGLSRLLTAANPESGTTSYTYDANGNILTKTSPAPNQTNPNVTQTISYCYDTLNRVISKWYTTPTCSQASPIANYFYDQTSYNGLTITNGFGRRTGMSDTTGATAWSYDSMGRPLTKRHTIGTSTKTTGHTYNLDGSIATISNPGVGRVITYTTSAAGQITAVQNTGGGINFLQSAHYAPFGALTSATESSGAITITNTFNKRLQPALISASSTSGTILSLCYDFHIGSGLNLSPCSFSGTSPGDNGNVYAIANNRDGNRSQNFLYDSLNRIQQAYTTGPNWGETFSSSATNAGVPPSTSGIDAWGNLTNRSPVNGKTNYELLNCPANVKNQLMSCSINYDAAGNVMSNGSASYTYDAENRLTAAGGYTYSYDGNGHRVKKTNGSTGTLYYSDMDGQVLNESSLGATNLREYIYLGDKRIARIDVPTPLTVKYYFSDRLASASVITDASGTMPPLEESDYFPYGGEIQITNNDSNTYKFTGKERDTETCAGGCLDFFGARHYASSLARFMSPDDRDWSYDPSSPQTWNSYSYVGNSPTAATDPNGQDCIYVDPDSGAFEGWNRGDCFNGTEKAANAGIYVNGSIDSITYNQQTGSLDYGYTDESGNSGVGTILGAAPPQPLRMDNGAASAGLLGPGDLILFSGVRAPTWAAELFGKMFGSVAEKFSESSIQTLGLEGAAEAANEVEINALISRAASTVGDQGATASSEDIALAAAEDWVGPGARTLTDRTTGKIAGKISADGTKQYRITSLNKANPYVNIENRVTGGNLHVRF